MKHQPIPKPERWFLFNMAYCSRVLLEKVRGHYEHFTGKNGRRALALQLSNSSSPTIETSLPEGEGSERTLEYVEGIALAGDAELYGNTGSELMERLSGVSSG